MAVLSDRDIKKYIARKELVIEPFDEKYLSSASIDLTLGNKFRIFKHLQLAVIDPHKGVPEELTEIIEVKDNEPFVVHPNELILGITRERIRMPPTLVARLDGRSSLARLGIIIHSTAGSVDPGWEGHIVLEIANIAKVPVLLWPGMRICRITFETLSSKCEKPYNRRKEAKYHLQKEPLLSKIYEELSNQKF